MKISVVGLGKLGSSMVAGFAEAGFEVIGYDINAHFVKALNNGEAPVHETDLQNYINKNRTLIKATNSLERAISDSSITFVVVPTPSNPDGSFTSEYAKTAFKNIGEALGSKTEYHTIVMTSTVLPGVTRTLLIPELEKASGKKCGSDFGVCYNPEFIALGSVIRDFLNPDFYLLGEYDSRSGDSLEAVHRRVSQNKAPVRRMTIENAELAKIALNSFVTMKISFANTLSDICSNMLGGDVDVVTEAIGTDTRIGKKYLKGGMGFAGPCFPRDNVALAYFAEKLNCDGSLLAANHVYNEHFSEKTADRISEIMINEKSIGILGLAYKPKSYITEQSCGLKIAKRMRRKSVEVYAFDPLSNLMNTDEVSDINIVPSIEKLLRKCETIVICNADPEFSKICDLNIHDKKVIDMWRAFPELENKVKNYIPNGKSTIGHEAQNKMSDIWSNYE